MNESKHTPGPWHLGVKQSDEEDVKITKHERVMYVWREVCRQLPCKTLEQKWSTADCIAACYAMTVDPKLGAHLARSAWENWLAEEK